MEELRVGCLSSGGSGVARSASLACQTNEQNKQLTIDTNKRIKKHATLNKQALSHPSVQPVKEGQPSPPAPGAAADGSPATVWYLHHHLLH